MEGLERRGGTKEKEVQSNEKGNEKKKGLGAAGRKYSSIQTLISTLLNTKSVIE